MISIICAMDDNKVIGVNGQLPWKISEDMQFFRSITYGHTVVMGRKTVESLDFQPLPNRTNVVISSDLRWPTPRGFDRCYNINPIFNRSELGFEMFIIGGGALYNAALPKADKLYITHVDGKVETTHAASVARFSDLNLDMWKKSFSIRSNDVRGGIHTFAIYTKN